MTTFTIKRPFCDQRFGHTHFPPYRAKRCMHRAVDGCTFCDKNFCGIHLLRHACKDDIPFDKVLEETKRSRQVTGHGRRW